LGDEEKKEILIVATLIARKANEATVGSGEVCVLKEYGVKCLICVGAYGKNLASITVYKFCTLQR